MQEQAIGLKSKESYMELEIRKEEALSFGDNLYYPKTEIISGVLEKECSLIITQYFRDKRNKNNY